jgi:hypothetical protein
MKFGTGSDSIVVLSDANSWTRARTSSLVVSSDMMESPGQEKSRGMDMGVTLCVGQPFLCVFPSTYSASTINFTRVITDYR